MKLEANKQNFMENCTLTTKKLFHIDKSVESIVRLICRCLAFVKDLNQFSKMFPILNFKRYFNETPLPHIDEKSFKVHKISLHLNIERSIKQNFKNL